MQEYRKHSKGLKRARSIILNITELNKKAFWEKVNYSTNLEFGKYVIEKIFTDEEILNKTVLDIGCGTGIYSLIFKQKGARNITGIDFSESSIKTAKSQLEKAGSKDVQFLNADIRNHNFPGESFDIIWCHGVIYYMPNPYETMRKLCGLVSQNGVIFISLMKNTNYSKIVNSIRKILYRIPKNLWGITSLLISSLFFFILSVFNKKVSFSRIRTKVLAQYFPIIDHFDIKEAKTFFRKSGFKTEKIVHSLDVFSYTTQFGLKLRKQV